MKYIIYKTVNILNQKYYIGVHKTKCHKTFDGYYGSGTGLKRAMVKYGKEHFERSTLEVHDDVEIAYKREQEILGEDYKSDDCYNMRNGGRGIRNVRIDNHSPEWCANQSRLMTGRKASAETRKKLSKIDRSYMKTPEYKEALRIGRLNGKPSPGSKPKPDDQVSEHALYMREYRRLKALRET